MSIVQIVHQNGEISDNYISMTSNYLESEKQIENIIINKEF